MGLVGGRGGWHRAAVLLSSVAGQYPRAAPASHPQLAGGGRLPPRPGREDESDLQSVRVHAVPRPKDPRLSFSVAYDAIAAGYDEQVRGDDWMRRVLHAHYARVFRPGLRVLDVGCGTGMDALALARMGISVLGIDGSAAMIQRLNEKEAVAGVDSLIE